MRSSNADHLLFSGMVRDDRARRVAADLLRPHFFTGWGIRTIGLGEARYNLMSYHKARFGRTTMGETQNGLADLNASRGS